MTFPFFFFNVHTNPECDDRCGSGPVIKSDKTIFGWIINQKQF